MESGTDLLEKALQIARERGYAEVSLETDEVSFNATLTPIKKKRSAPSSGESEPGSGKSEPSSPEAITVKSSLVGYFQLPSKDFKVGSKVEPEDVVAIITVFGINNDVESSCQGTVAEIFVKDGDAVEYGQPLMSLQVDHS